MFDEDQIFNAREANEVMRMVTSVTYSERGFEDRVKGWMDGNGFLTGLLPYVAQYPNMSKAVFRAPKGSVVGEITATRRFEPTPGYDDVSITYVANDRYVRIRNSYIHVFETPERFDSGKHPIWNYRTFLVNGKIEYIAVNYPGMVLGHKVNERPAFLNYLLVKAAYLFQDRDDLMAPIRFSTAATAHLGREQMPGSITQLDHYQCRPEHYEWFDRLKASLQGLQSQQAKAALSEEFSKSFVELTRYITPKHKRRVLER